MKHALILAAFISSNALALTNQQIENMGAQCDQVMDEGQCRVALDPKSYPNATVLIMNSNGASRVSTAAYLRIRGANDAKTVDGKWVMCQRVRECRPGSDSDDCKVAAALFSTLPPAARPPSASTAQTIRP